MSGVRVSTSTEGDVPRMKAKREHRASLCRRAAQIVAGCDDPETLAALAQGRLKSKSAALERALHGRLGQHQRLMLGEQLQHIEELEGRIGRLSAERAAHFRDS